MSHFDQPTQPFPSLPPGNGNGTAVPVPHAGYPLLPYQPSPYGPIPAAQRQRGAGYWVGITAAIATGVILALFAGFFIGRGTRLSNSAAQSKITEQAQSDQIAEQQALSAQKAADQNAQNKAVAQAQKNGEAQGLRQGEIQGQQQGFQQGQQQGYQQGQATGQAQGFQQGQTQGYQQGQSDGFSQGYSSGVCSSSGLVC
jgi:hypothetical protein